MDNQHKMIKGYRELNAQEIALINDIKKLGMELKMMSNRLKNTTDNVSIDPRWQQLGEDELQKGLMSWVRSVAQPEGF